MAAKPSIPKGTRDFSPVEMAKRNYIFNTIRDVYRISSVWFPADRNSVDGDAFYTDGEIWR